MDGILVMLADIQQKLARIDGILSVVEDIYLNLAGINGMQVVVKDIKPVFNWSGWYSGGG